jgi:hypothetical protein
MPELQTTFQVVTMALERADLINRFTRYYLDIGASKVVVCHDGPVPAGVTRADAIEHIALDDAFWAAAPEPRPDDHLFRQKVAHQYAVEHADTDWTLVVDIDEYLAAPTPFAQVLGRLPPQDQSIRIRNAEAVWGPGDRIGETLTCSYLRFATRPGRTRRLLKLLHGNQAEMLRMGVTGYSHGKHAVRNGDTGLRVGVHFSSPDGIPDGEPYGRWLHKVLPDRHDVFITHFDAIDYDHWVEKWQRRRGTPWARRNQGDVRHSLMAQKILQALSTDDGGQAARALFQTLHGATRWQAFWLQFFGFLKPLRLFADPATGAAAQPVAARD